MVGAGLAVAGLAWFAPRAYDGAASPSDRGEGSSASSSAVSKPASPSPFAALPHRPDIGDRLGELFGASAPPARPIEPPAAAPEPPTAPANPYKFAARLIQSGAATVFLAKGERILEVKAGDVLEGGYRVESIAAERIVLVYVPLGTKDELPASSTLGIDAPPAAPRLAGSAPSGEPASAAVAEEDPSKPAQLRWEGPAQVLAGKSFSVALRVSSGQQVRASPMQLSFKPELLEALGVRAGKFFGEGSFSYRINPDGSIFVGASTAGSAPGADAELLVVTFRPIKAGATAEVGLSSLALQGAAGRAIAYDQISAFRTAIQ
jgi:hypothetical protein